MLPRVHLPLGPRPHIHQPTSRLRPRWCVLPLLFCLTTLLIGVPAQASYINNGGFESGLTNWSASQGNGAATFTATANDHKFDSQSLQVVVSNVGNGSNYPRLTYTTAIPANSANTYTLSFFAKCPNSTMTNRPSKLRIHFDNGGGGSSYDYQPSNRWEEFHYSFKNTSGSQTFSITFEGTGTYELDRFLLEDQYEPDLSNQCVLDTPLSYLWQFGQAYRPNPNYYVTGTDNDIGQQLPDGRVAWIFNDSDLGPLNFGTNYRGDDTGFVNNAIVVQDGSTLTNLKPNSPVFTPLNGSHIFWPLDATIEGGKLKTMLSEVDPGNNYAVVGYWLATHNLPGLTEASPFFVGVPWGGQILDGVDGYFYIYKDSLDNQKKLARTPIGSLGDGSQWRFWNGSTWVTDQNAAVALTNFSNAYVAISSVERLGTNNYVAISYGYAGGTVGVHFANNPVGPWTDYRSIYNVPGEDGQFYYDFHIYKHLGQNGVYSLGFSDYMYGNDPGKPFDRDYYMPQFLKTPNLLALSPYTSTSFSDSFPSTVNDFTNWQTYGGSWSEGFGAFVIDATASANNGARAIAKGIVLSNFTYEVDVQTGATGADLGATFRTSEQFVGVNAFKGYYAGFKPGTGVVLYRMDGTNATQIGSAATSIAANASYHLKITGSGSTLKVFVGNSTTAAITATDATYGSGGFGLRSYNASGYFKNVNVHP